MSNKISLQFLDGQDPGFELVSLMFLDELCTLFTLSLTVQCTNACIDLSDVVGKRVAVVLGDGSLLPRVTGIIREVRVLSTETTGTSYYLLAVVPPLWLTTCRVNYRIFQDRTAPEIVTDVLTPYGQRMPAPVNKATGTYRRRAHTAQYGETDYAFISRILADEGIASFFDHDSDSAWTLVDPTSTQTPEHTGAIPFVPESLQNAPPVPSIQTAVVTGGLRTSVVSLQDYDHTNPEYAIKAKETAEGAALYVEEPDIEACHFAVGDVRTCPDADKRAKRLLEATRVSARHLMLTMNTAVGAGMRITAGGHPRDDVNKPLLVVRSNVAAQSSGSTQQIECIDKDTPFRPPYIPPPRIIGTQTARVVPSTGGKEIDANALGEVKVRFLWDRRNKDVDTSRYVRVSQAWAGRDYGLVCLPRVGDEVVVDFLDGDPDEPVIVGRLHNGVNVRPHNTDEEQTVSVWRSKSSPGGNGYNEILMDDKASAERLELHAQRDFKSETGHDSVTTVGNNASSSVAGNSTNSVKGAYSLSSGSTSISTGAYALSATTITESARTTMLLSAGDKRTDESANHFLQSGSFYVTLGDVFQVNASHMHVFCSSSIKLVCGGSSIVLTPGAVTIESAVVDVKGQPIKLNS